MNYDDRLKPSASGAQKRKLAHDKHEAAVKNTKLISTYFQPREKVRYSFKNLNNENLRINTLFLNKGYILFKNLRFW